MLTQDLISQDIAQTIVDPKAYADGRRVDEAFTRLRREAPLAIARPDGFDPFWVVTRNEDIRQVEVQNELFHNGDRSTTLAPTAAIERVKEITGGSPHLVRSLVQMDNPDHFNYRRLTQAYFLPQNLKKLEARVRELAKEFVDRMEDLGGECDFARDVAFLYPLRVIMEVLGVPQTDELRMLKLTQELFGAADPDLKRTPGTQDADDIGQSNILGTIGDFMTYFNAMTEERRAKPRDDLASVIANGVIEGQPLGHLEAMSYYIIAATAGHDTTSNTTAGGLWAVCETPGEFQRLKGDLGGLMPTFLEETIRWVTPVKHFMRSATADTELGGQRIAKGDWLMLSYPSGNRDEAVFDDPFRFDSGRKPNRHVAFGYGAHVCLGQHLAKLEMRLLWEELIPRLKSIELNGEPKRMEAAFVCGPKSVPVRYRFN